MLKASRSEASIQLSGESGTGKEVAAKAIHGNSPRGARVRRDGQAVRPGSLRAFESYSWPVNIRELQNVVRRMCVLADGQEITMRDVSGRNLADTRAPSGATGGPPPAGIEACELGFGPAKNPISHAV
jgi:DNA-binding NtrC family response regulator